MDPDRAVPEGARVLRDGGRLGLIWTSRDREVDWVRRLDRLRTSPRLEPDEQVAAQRHRHDVTVPDAAPFEHAGTASFTFTRRMALDDVVRWVGTYSVVLTAPLPEREAGLERVRAALVERFGTGGVIDVPMRSWCWRADRVAR
jgi:hypothetical protein